MHFLAAYQVNFTTNDLGFTKGKELALWWDPDDVFPLEASDNYAIDIELHKLTEKPEWVSYALLATNITNSGLANFTLPDLNTSNTGLQGVFPFALRISRSTAFTSETGTTTRNITQPGIWTSVAYYSSSQQYSHTECVKWASEKGSRQSELLSIDSLPPCPCTSKQAQAPNSGMTEQNSRLPFHQYFNGSKVPVCYYSSIPEYQ